MSNIPKDDTLVVGKDLPESYTKWSKTGNTTMVGWPKEGVDMTFEFDFNGVPLETVFGLAVSALVIDSRPARKKEGFEFCKKNPKVSIIVADLKKRGVAQPRNLAAVLVKSLETGTSKEELSKLSAEQLQTYLAAIEETLAQQAGGKS